MPRIFYAFAVDAVLYTGEHTFSYLVPCCVDAVGQFWLEGALVFRLLFVEVQCGRQHSCRRRQAG